MIVGFSNTAVDTATSLVGHAEKIYLSHRGGAIIVSADTRLIPGPNSSVLTSHQAASSCRWETSGSCRIAANIFNSMPNINTRTLALGENRQLWRQEDSRPSIQYPARVADRISSALGTVFAHCF
jgi:cation diffusion facilitator CzcD-associated flavoprotein CzcO